ADCRHGVAASALSAQRQPRLQPMKRRHFLQAMTASTAAAAAAAATAADTRFEWLEASASSLAAAMAQGRTSSLALTRAYAERIAAIDAAGPKLASVIELNPDAEALAAQLDAERAAGRLRGPLHGIPV